MGGVVRVEQGEIPALGFGRGVPGSSRYIERATLDTHIQDSVLHIESIPLTQLGVHFLESGEFENGDGDASITKLFD